MSKDDDKQEHNKERKVLTSLTPEEEAGLRKKFNIEFDKKNSKNKITNDHKTTRDKIREIEEKALKKIKNNIPDDVG